MGSHLKEIGKTAIIALAVVILWDKVISPKLMAKKAMPAVKS